MIYFTSDTHYGHKNIIEYAGRSTFADVTDMREGLIQRWNAVVHPEDTVYHLGDFAFCAAPEATQIARRLLGHKHLVFGNHDSKLRKDAQFLMAWETCSDLKEIKVPDAAAERGTQRIVLCHYAFRVWNHSHRGSWSLFGHSHGTMPDDPGSLSMDVGVDVGKRYTPFSYDEVKAQMSQKTWQPVDRHDRGRE